MLLRLSIIVSILCIAGIQSSFLLINGAPEVKMEDDVFYLGGIQIEEPDPAYFTQLVKDVGMNTIEITHYADQADWDGDDLNTLNSKEKSITEIQLAKKAGLKVVLILRVRLLDSIEKNKFLWHGMIMPKDKQSITNWFDKYQEYVTEWAEICEREAVDLLVVGSEMNALCATKKLERMPTLYSYYNNQKSQRIHEGQVLQFRHQIESSDLWKKGKESFGTLEKYVEEKIEAQYKWGKQVCFQNQKNALELINERRILLASKWRSIIKNCRDIYSGKLSYAANFDNYQEVDFWDDLDFIGINAYFPITDLKTNCTDLSCYEKVTYKNWRKVLKDMSEFLSEEKLQSKSMLFTELGYINRKYATIEPWKGFDYSIVKGRYGDKLIIWNEQEENLIERAGAILGLRKAIRKENFPLVGILYWKLTSHPPNLKNEPYGLLISQPPVDLMQNALIEFLQS
jgi:hypothetical protein